jgi:hypothetical protein
VGQSAALALGANHRHVTSLPSSSLLRLAVRLAALVDIMTFCLGLIGEEASITSESSLSTSSSHANVLMMSEGILQRSPSYRYPSGLRLYGLVDCLFGRCQFVDRRQSKGTIHSKA